MKVKRIPHSIYLVGKASKHKEVKWKDLSADDRKKFREAIARGWGNFERYKATVPVNDDMLKKLPQDQKISGTRWVLTWKAPGLAKARLVVQGCQEKALKIRSDAPTASRDAMMMVFLFGSQKHWTLGQYGAECAYLQSEGLGRSLLCRMPDPVPPTKFAGEVVAATGAIYGTKDAGRKWY